MEEIYLHSLSSIPLNQIVKSEYRNYQIYTLMDRAIPYLRDGLKPCQRRILYTLWRHSQKGLMKVSSATGLVLTLHPHGPASIEASIVNMAQDFAFANNYPLIDKKGYFGERMEPQPAASRYIECKLGKLAKFLLFEDMNQVQMIPNYDERVMEPVSLVPKLPLMLLNGAEGIGTGFSSVIPSFHHRDIIDSMVNVIKKGKTKKLKPWARHYSLPLGFDERGRIITSMRFEERDGKVYITELPKGYDAQKTYKYLSKHVEKDYIKDFIDSTVDNDVLIELMFKRGTEVDLEDVILNMTANASIVPNYTLISERGVKIFDRAEDIVKIFTEQRIEVVKRRYELLTRDAEKRIAQNSEIIRFIQEKHYAKAQSSENRKTFVEYLKKKKFTFADYLADMAIYRMTKEEVKKREQMLKDDKKKMREYKRVANSGALVKEKLYEELMEVREVMDKFLKDEEKARKELRSKMNKKKKKVSRKRG